MGTSEANIAADEYGTGFATQEMLAILSHSGIEDFGGQKQGPKTNSNYESACTHIHLKCLVENRQITFLIPSGNCSITADKSHMRATTFKEVEVSIKNIKN